MKRTALFVLTAAIAIAATTPSPAFAAAYSYWRDLRTFTLQDPVAYKFRDVGNYVLSGEYSAPSQYA